MGFFGERGGDDGLAEAEPVGAEFALDLKAMEVKRDFEVSEKVGAVENAVLRLHVEKFNGEDVGGAVQFFAGEDERGVVAFFNPPFRDGVERFEIFGVGVTDETEDVEVGLASAEFSGGGGTVEDDGHEICAGGGVKAVEEFFELGFHVIGRGLAGFLDRVEYHIFGLNVGERAWGSSLLRFCDVYV